MVDSVYGRCIQKCSNTFLSAVSDTTAFLFLQLSNFATSNRCNAAHLMQFNIMLNLLGSVKTIVQDIKI